MALRGVKAIQLTPAQLEMLRDVLHWVEAAGTQSEFYETNQRRWRAFEGLCAAVNAPKA